MPDGAPQQPPLDPAAQRAQEQMRQWKQQHQDPNSGGGWFGNVISTVDGLVAAAEAGQFAVDPNTGAAIVKQLEDVQNQVGMMMQSGGFAQAELQLGGGYATNIATFNQKLTRDETTGTLMQFAKELEQLKAAVSRSVANYGSADSGSGQNIKSSGDGLS